MAIIEFGSEMFFGEMFSFFLTFLLFFTVIFGILLKTKFLSDRPDLNALVAFAIAMITGLTGVVSFIAKTVPYFMLLFLVVFVLVFLGKFIGYDMDKLMHTKYTAAILALAVIAIFAGVGWQDYSATLAAQLNVTNVTNATGLNLTGNPVTDAIATYNFQCALKGELLLPYPNALCIILHPRVFGAYIVLAIMIVVSMIFVSSKK